MRKIRVLVVDDSVVVRRVITTALAGDPAFEVVGTAANGKLALPKVSLLRPDAITLDIEMPEMDGLSTIPHIRRINPRVPIIMFSTLSKPGASATLDALSAGATDFCTKPMHIGGLDEGVAMIKRELLPKVKALCAGITGMRPSSLLGATLRPAATTSSLLRPATHTTATHTTSATPTPSATPRPIGPPARVEAVVVAVSTGGPTALRTVWDSLPATLGVPVLVVQHMPPMFTTLLAQRLNDVGHLPMSEGVNGAVVQPGKAWLAPGDHHMTVRRDGNSVKLHLDQGPPENSCRPAADPLFRSAVNVWGKGVLAVVLTGMGADGLHGSEAVAAAGGQIIAQDEATSVVWGMPGQIVQHGIADAVVPLNEVASTIAARVAGRMPMVSASRSDRAEVRT
jgi:two-component system, chemotaxis family, protein-glutamate methylesterase/glutaminase